MLQHLGYLPHFLIEFWVGLSMLSIVYTILASVTFTVSAECQWAFRLRWVISANKVASVQVPFSILCWETWPSTHPPLEKIHWTASIWGTCTWYASVSWKVCNVTWYSTFNRDSAFISQWNCLLASGKISISQLHSLCNRLNILSCGWLSISHFNSSFKSSACFCSMRSNWNPVSCWTTYVPFKNCNSTNVQNLIRSFDTNISSWEAARNISSSCISASTSRVTIDIWRISNHYLVIGCSLLATVPSGLDWDSSYVFLRSKINIPPRITI